MLNEKPVLDTAGEPSPSDKPRADHRSRWRKGQSGNPRGRPKSDFTIQALAQQHSLEGLHRLVAIMRDEKTKPETVATVVGMLWDRGYGKAAQFLAVDAKVEFNQSFESFIRSLGPGDNAKVINEVPALVEEVKSDSGEPS